MDRRRCGGVAWDLLGDRDWDLYTSGKVAPYPIELTWVVSPIRSAVAVQTGSVEHMLCLCAYRGHESQLRNLLSHASFADEDIHPAARADLLIFLDEQHLLEQVLLKSEDARLYVSSLNAAHIHNLDLVEKAQDFCRVVEAQQRASEAANECFDAPLWKPTSGRKP